MNVLLLASAFVTLAAPQKKAPVQVTVNAKPGETITGERTFRVTVTSKNPVTGVEFYAGSDLREKDTSTPYQFTLDTLVEQDGKMALRFRAFTTEGEEGSATVNVVIDNGASKGLAFHLDAANAALAESKWDTAITSGRVALKLDAKSNDARFILARAYFAKNQLDKAQKFAEDAGESDPNNPKVNELLTAIRLRQAFTTVNRPGSERKELLKTIGEAYKGAIDSRRKAVDAAFDALGAPTAENRLAYADAALRAGRNSSVISALDPAFRADNRQTAVANRLAYAQLRSGRAQDAVNTLSQLKKYGQPDAYSFAAYAVALAESGDAAASDEAMKEAILNAADDPAVLSAQAYIALKFVRRKIADRTELHLNYDDARGLDAPAKAESRRLLQSTLSQLLRDNAQKTEVLTFASALNNRLQEYTKGQTYFEQAVLADALNGDAYLEQGNRSIALTLQGQPSAEDLELRYENARVHFEAALAARPSSAEALTGLSLVAAFQKKLDEAVKWGDAAVKASPTYAPGHVALGTAAHLASVAKRSEADRIRRSTTNASSTNADRQANELKARELETEAIRLAAQGRDTVRNAAVLDKRIEGLELTDARTAWRYFYAGGRTPLLPLPR
ncbi:MAG: tetratricopeptide repeat protein [Fimbriimonas sp.]